MKRKVLSSFVLKVYDSLFSDFRMWSNDPLDYTRDLERIKLLVSTRGSEQVLLVEFPSYAKSFDLALSFGNAHLIKMPLLGRGSGIPLFMRRDFLMIFDEETGLLRDEPSLASIKNIRQVLLLWKKVLINCPKGAEDEAISQFMDIDRGLRHPTSPWSDVVPNWDQHVSLTQADEPGENLYPRKLLNTAQAVADLIVSSFTEFRPEDLVGNHGPGAVSDTPSGEKYDKYSPHFWSERLEAVFPYCHHTFPNISAFTEECGMDEDFKGLHTDCPARLIAVPKTYDKPRLIASEPTSNQFIQGGIRRYLREQIRNSRYLSKPIDIGSQVKSQDFARVASMDKQFCTVDLKDASDRLSLWTVERLFRKREDLLTGISASRSIDIIVKDRGEIIQYRMKKYAPQGNASVFPLQSIVYTILAITAILYSRGQVVNSRTVKSAANMVRVYGDDIIMPTHGLLYLSYLLKALEMKVNSKKTHYNGNFAESCGLDAFKGQAVTACYLRHIWKASSPESVSSCIQVSNNFYAEGYIRTANLISGLITRHYQNLVCQLGFQDYLGNTEQTRGTPMRLISFAPASPRKRWSKEYQRFIELDLVIKTRTNRIKRDSWVSLAQYCIENPSAETNWSSGWNKTSKSLLSLARG